MAKDKVFSASVRSGKQYMSNGKSWLDYYYEDQERRRKEAEAGKVRYTEAAKASRIQYSLPQYQGKSQNQGKTYSWERDLMQNTKIKGAGNSYTKKFDALTKSMGMTPGQAEEFRKYMDFQEDSQHVDPKMNKDKTINQSQSLKYARDSHLKVDVIDGILKNMQKVTADKVKKAKENDIKFTEDTQKAAENSTKERGGFLGLLDRTLGRAGDNALKVFGEQFAHDNNAVMQQNNIEELKQDPTDKQALDQLQMLNTTGREAQGGLEKTSDFVGRSLGEIAPYTIGGAYGAADAVLGKLGLTAIKSPLAKEAIRGATAGGVVGTGKAITRDATAENPEDFGAKDYLKTIGLEAGLAGAGDAGIGALARNLNLKGMTKGLSDDLANQYAKSLGGGRTPEQIALALRESVTPKNVLADPTKMDPQHVLEQLTDGWSKKPPVKINDWQAEAPKAEVPVQEPGPNPQVAYEEANKTWDMRKAAEDDFVQKELAPIHEVAQKQAQAQQTWESVVKEAKAHAQRIKEYHGKIVPDGLSKDAINEIPPQFRGAKGGKGNDIYSFAEQEGFANADEAIAFLKQIDADSKMKLKDLMPEDSHVYKEHELQALEDAARQRFAGSDEGKAVDDVLTKLINEIQGNTGPKAEIPNAPTPGIRKTPAELLEEAKNNGIVNNSQAPEQVLDELVHPKKPETEAVKPESAPASEVPTTEQVKARYSELTDEANRLVFEKPEGFMEDVQKIGEEIQQIDEAVKAAESGDSSMLMRLNIQNFAPSSATSLVETRAPISTQSPIAKITNPVKRLVNKFYEGYVNRNHSAKLTEVQSLETAINKAKAEGRVKKAEQLASRLKQVKRSGSDFDKALGNELASSSAAKNFLDRHFASLSETMGGDMKEMTGALEFQMAKNLDYIKQNVDPNYELPDGWDWGDINTIINGGANNTKYANFMAQFRNMTQEWRDTMLDYGLINKEAHEALGKNPYYIPMQRDMSQVFDNIDVGYGGIGKGSKGRGSGDGIVYGLDGGSVETFFKNPLETVVDHSFKLYKNAYRNDTAQQALKMAELDKDGTLGLAKEISAKNAKTGDLAVFVNGEKRYVRLQDDLVKIMNENESVLDLGKIGKVTQLFAALKTRSFEYQTAAAPRDMVQAYVTSQVSNPIRYLSEVLKAIKNKNASAKEVGAYFDKAYNDHVAGVDPAKVLKEFQQQAGNVKVFNVKDPQSWKEVGGVVKKILDTPFKPSKWLGQITDEIPREIEVKEAERLFMKQNGKKMESIQTALNDVNKQIQAAQGAPNFSPQTQGIDKLIGQKEKLENMLRQFQQDLRREQTYRGRDVMDYSRMGNSKATKNIIRPWVIFANTTTQSKDKVIRSFIERPGATIAKITTVAAPFVAAEKINFDSMNESDRKLYDNLPDYIKQYNYIYIKDGTTHAVPKLQELALLTNPIEAALKGDSLDDSMQLLMKETLPYQTGMIAQGFGPKAKDTTPTQNMQLPSTVFSPGVDILANRKLGFNQKPVSFGGFYKGADAKANDWTMEMFKRLIGDNPGADKTQYGVQQYGGDAGKYATYSLDALLDPSNEKKIDEMLRNLNPIQDRLFKDSRYFKPTPQETKK